MTRVGRLALGCLVVGPVLVGCSDQGEAAEPYEPSEVEEQEGSDLARVHFTEIGAQAVGLETEVAREVDGRTAVDYAALIYDGAGDPWVYRVTGELAFERAAVVVERIEDGQVLISSGLEPGAEVVTTGVAEVYGTELDIAGSH